MPTTIFSRSLSAKKKKMFRLGKLHVHQKVNIQQINPVTHHQFSALQINKLTAKQHLQQKKTTPNL